MSTKTIKVAINGFGRIGRTTYKAAVDYLKSKGSANRQADRLEIVAVNDLMDTKTLAHLVKYDSVYGIWEHKISFDEKHLIVDGQKIFCFAEKEPNKLPWKNLNIDVVLECTGRFTSKEGAELHLQAGAKKVIVSAPVKGGGVPTYILGVNADKYKGESLINNASCTTNCIAPVAKIVEENFGIKKALMTTTHAITAEQNLVDGPPPALHKDYRRARSAFVNMIPTTTGAAIATAETLPSLRGIFDGLSVRVPIICASLADFTFLLKKKTTVEEVSAVFKKAAASKEYKGIVEATEEPIVSSDIIGNTHSAIVDLGMLKIVDNDLLKVFAWYDNEWGYSCRLIELAQFICTKIKNKK